MSRAAALRWRAASQPLDKLKLEGDEQIGVNIVKRALEEPLRQIVGNAGEEGAVVLGKVLDSKDTNYGYNALTDEFEDLVKAGVLDPTKVVRTALQNAGSIASPDAHHRSPGRRDCRKRRKLRAGGGGHGGGMEGMY